MSDPNEIARQIVDIAVRHSGDTDAARTAMDHLLMDHGPQAVEQASQILER